MNRIFKILYFTNLTIIILSLLSPVVNWATKTGEYNWSLAYYSILILGSFTFCVSFIFLNIYGMIKYKVHRLRFLLISIIIGLWIVAGIYQFIYQYTHDITI